MRVFSSPSSNSSLVTQLTVQLLVSALIVIAVLWFMWRLPRDGERFFAWAPPLALISAWGGLVGLIYSGLLWVLPFPDRWLVLVFLILDPMAIGAGTLVLWIYRGHEATSDTIDAQALQARVGIGLGLVAVAIGYFFVLTSKAPMTPVGQ